MCSVLLGDDPASLQNLLQKRFPRATMVPEDAAFTDLVAAVVAKIEEPARSVDLPLDIRGTSFQQRVLAGPPPYPGGQHGHLQRGRRRHRRAEGRPRRGPGLRQ